VLLTQSQLTFAHATHRVRAMRMVLVGVVLLGCNPTPREGGNVDAAKPVDVGVAIDAPPPCEKPATPAGPDVQLAPPFDALYTVYDLGPVPGVPNSLGGTVIRPGSNDKLLVAGGSESSGGAIYEITVKRNTCGNIIGFVGTATQVASTPYVDANLVFTSANLLLYTEWPQYTLAQLTGTATAPDRRTDLRPLGMPDSGDSGPGGLGIVPPGLASAGELRAVTWPGGRWYHVATAPDGSLMNVQSITEKTVLPNQPGGFAYVPAGSPGFAAQSLIVAEWHTDTTLDRVAVYTVDASGDPVVSTRREFFQKFPHPWGAYFEPVKGDYLFLSWGTGDDHLYIVQGFVPPPPLL
jgi:hypothetical protein